MPATKLDKKQVKNLTAYTNTAIKTTNYTAADKDRVLVDSTGGALNITLPTGVEGMMIVVQDIGGSATTNNITVVGTINGNVNYVIANNFGNVELLFSDGDWIIVSKEPSGGGGGAGHIIQDEGTPVAQEPALDIRGVGVDVLPEVGKTAIVVNDKHIISQSQQDIVANYTIQPGYNGFSVGPINVQLGVTVTVSAGSVWAIL